VRDSVRSSRLPNDVRVSDGAEEDRRKVQADGFPSRAADDGRRSAARRRVLLSAIIVDLGADGFVRCRLENVSDGGACLRLTQRRFLPPTFWLVAITSGLAYRAKIAWRSDDRLGVSLEDPGDLSDPANLLERRLRRIWLIAR
jgi:hypothetical protein